MCVYLQCIFLAFNLKWCFYCLIKKIYNRFKNVMKVQSRSYLTDTYKILLGKKM